jgi:excinuclease ABC subunit C
VSRAVKVADELGLDIPIAGLAKRMEEVYLPGRPEPVRIPRGEDALYLLQRVRDEAHRFANQYHRSLRGKRMVDSILDDVPGIGPARKKALLREFGSLKRLREAEPGQLAEIVPDAVAADLRDGAPETYVFYAEAGQLLCSATPGASAKRSLAGP